MRCYGVRLVQVMRWCQGGDVPKVFATGPLRKQTNVLGVTIFHYNGGGFCGIMYANLAHAHCSSEAFNPEPCPNKSNSLAETKSFISFIKGALVCTLAFFVTPQTLEASWLLLEILQLEADEAGD